MGNRPAKRLVSSYQLSAISYQLSTKVFALRLGANIVFIKFIKKSLYFIRKLICISVDHKAFLADG